MVWPSAFSAARIPLPAYDRAAVRTGIVHFGLGNFHRAHEAMFVDRLMADGDAAEWGICGVGVMPQDARMRDVLRAQDGLYTLVLKHPDGTLEPRVIGSVHDYLFAPDDPEAVLTRLAAPTTRIVSLTVTEGGYNIDRTTGEFDVTHPAVVADAAGPAHPSTVFGYIVAGLARRRADGIAPFTVMSCDNIPGNGAVARRVLVAYAALAAEGLGQPDLAEWIASEVAFPDSMVDRITPVTTDADRELVAERFGIDDAWPVMAEPFVQWALEDRFPLGRPRFEDVGVQVVDDVEPFELMKLRLLNGSHQALAHVGRPLGHVYAHEATLDPDVERFVRVFMAEALPTLPAVPGVDLDEYSEELIRRFANPHILDTLARLGTDASDRVPKFVLPAVRDNLAAGRPVDAAAALVACWARCEEGTDELGGAIGHNDPLHDELAARARAEGDDLAFLRCTEVFGDLAESATFAAAYRDARRTLREEGTRGLLARFV